MKLIFLMLTFTMISYAQMEAAEAEEIVPKTAPKWWSSFRYNCGQGDRGEQYVLPERECIQRTLVSPLKNIEPRILSKLKQTVDMEMDFECIKRTVHFIRQEIVNSASLGFTSVTFYNHFFYYNPAALLLTYPRVIDTPLISCEGINDCNLFIHGVQQEIVYMFKGSKINISKSDDQIKILEINWD